MAVGAGVGVGVGADPSCNLFGAATSVASLQSKPTKAKFNLAVVWCVVAAT